MAEFLSVPPLHPPYQFVGYWGAGQSLNLEQDLSQLLQRYSLPKPVVRRGQYSSEEARPCGSEASVGWAMAYLGLGATDDFKAHPLGEETCIAALSAGGIPTNLHPNGTMQPDAWVSLLHSPDGAPQLRLARDAFGRVPLYWMQRQQILWFASRLQLLLGLLPAESAAAALDPAALYTYSCFSYVPAPLTPLTAIRAVPAGMQQLWQVDCTGALRQTHHTPHQWQELAPPIHDEPTAIMTLQILLKEAVERQVADLGDQPVGVFLSGGLDSSIVAALLVQMGISVRAYTLDFGLADHSELAYAEQTARFLQIPLVTVDASPRQIRRAIAPTAAALDLPFGDGVTVPLFLLNRAAAQETAIVFNGEHGDQLFAGWTNKPLIAASIYGAVMADGSAAGGPTAAEDLFYQRYLKTFHRLEGHAHQIFQPALAAHCATLNPIDWLREALDPQFSTALLHRLRRASLMLKGAQNIQPRATALAFANGLRVRSPFCDWPLAQWTFRLSGDLCLRGACEKYILKRAVESWLPPEIVWRTKRGMGVPLTAWCFNELWHDLGIWLNPAVLQAQAHWQPNVAAQIITGELGADVQGRRMGECLWLMVMWQAWRTTVLSDAPPPRSWNHPFWLPPQLWRGLKQWKDSW